MPQSNEMDVDDGLSGERDSAIDLAARDKALDEQYPDRPRNHSRTLPFHSLFRDLFNPLNENKKKSTGPAASRRKTGPHGRSQNPQEMRRAIIERYISRWRREVGDDIFPAFRLIIPEKDRDRAMYGLKEKALGKFLVKIMKIDRNSEDGFSLLNWKLPGQASASGSSGDFAARCFNVISKRPFRVEVGDMTIGEVNDALDALSAEAKEESQLPILTRFYQRMNAEELSWLIRIILREMKIGATEKTIFHLWHPDAESLFNISSSLRRVCWELYNPSIRLEGEDCGVALMQCFQPQLAQFQLHDFKKIVLKMRQTEEDLDFWIEEKLDGERMQLHMISNDSVVGGKSFKFWSRKAKDYTYLYGEGFYDKESALTQHLKEAFAEGVENIILDGEMITWDPEQDRPCAFGNLKTAALSEGKNPFAGKERPLFRIFDILLLNDRPLTQYTLRDRRRALEASIKPVHRRFEVHDYQIGTKSEDIEASLRDIIDRASEGLVIKSPRSAYRLNDRNDDWMKVKPEYMEEYGENLDCLVIGGYYGSGRHGGGLSSFLCGLRENESSSTKEDTPHKFLSFFRVGGGMKANDYATIRHLTDGKWIDWDLKNPPTDYIELAGGALLRERPDVWIKPWDSVVIEAKAASVSSSDEYRCGFTLRFPRFKFLRQDKDWKSALSLDDFLDLKMNIEARDKQKKLEVDKLRQAKRGLNSRKRPLVVAGYNAKDVNGIKIEDSSRVQVFKGMTFYIMTESITSEKKSKPELEELVKAHGGKIVQTHTQSSATVERMGLDAPKEILCIADRRTVKVASLEKRADTLIIKPVWIFDTIDQAKADFARGFTSPRTLVWEPDRHLYFIPEEHEGKYDDNVDAFGDAMYRDTSAEELRVLMSRMGNVKNITARGWDKLVDADDAAMGEMKGWMFRGTTLFFYETETDQNTNSTSDGQLTSSTSLELETARTTATFAGAMIADSLSDKTITHIVVQADSKHGDSHMVSLRKNLSTRQKLPRVVTAMWIESSWEEGTRLDAERFAV